VDAVDLQREHHREADAEHFRWQTEAPFFASTEAALLDGVSAGPGERFLEMGCGEGGNLHHVAARTAGALRVGVDFSCAKAAFARRATGCEIAVADAARLPFADQSFDAILIRDLLHHLPDRARALAEAHRVLKPGGRLTLVEPNRRAPLVLLQAALVPAERGLLASSVERLRRELDDAGFRVLRFAACQPFPIARVLLHPRLGTAQLASHAPVRAMLRGAEALFARLVPPSAWLYLTFQAEK
jgi:SAM-dependent methyltransferase